MDRLQGFASIQVPWTDGPSIRPYGMQAGQTRNGRARRDADIGVSVNSYIEVSGRVHSLQQQQQRLFLTLTS